MKILKQIFCRHAFITVGTIRVEKGEVFINSKFFKLKSKRVFLEICCKCDKLKIRVLEDK